jgi:hypothetical protein
MSWKRIAGLAVGAGMVALGSLVPPAAALIPIGIGVVGYNVRNGEDRREIRKLKAELAAKGGEK